MKKKISFLFLIVVLIMGGFFYLRPADYVKISSHKFKAEIVFDVEARKKGLGGRDSLCLNCAMIFKFPGDGIYPFWMKDMRFDIDIIWARDGKIVYIAENADHNSLKTIDPGVPADTVVEINAGLSDKYGFKIGDEAVVE